jgi:hypothetical protein
LFADVFFFFTQCPVFELAVLKARNRFFFIAGFGFKDFYGFQVAADVVAFVNLSTFRFIIHLYATSV